MASQEREEGEIVENIEYEDISSEEEFTLRQRIEELEERNFELEQIANIQGFASNPYDLSTGGRSSERVGKENLHQRKRHGRSRSTTRDLLKKTPRRVCRPVKNPVRRKQQLSGRAKKRRKRAPSESSTDSECLLNRQELKLALNHSVNPSDDDVIEIPVEIPVITIDDDEEEDDVDVLKLRLEALQSKQEIREELEVVQQQQPSPPPSIAEETDEQQLRLIALKSAVVKKHEARKKRKEQEQRPYSPTDALDDSVIMTPPPDPKTDTMEISPVNSPATVPENLIASEIPAGEESEDELSLRESLLAKIESNHQKFPEEIRAKTPDSLAEVSLEEDCLRSLLLSTMKKPKSTTDPNSVASGDTNLISHSDKNNFAQICPQVPTANLIPRIISDCSSMRPLVINRIPRLPPGHNPLPRPNLITVPTLANLPTKSPKKPSAVKASLRSKTKSIKLTTKTSIASTKKKIKAKSSKQSISTKSPVSLPNSIPSPESTNHVPLNKTDVEKRSTIVTDLPVIKVSPLVIHLGQSDAESDDNFGSDTTSKNFDVDNKSPSSLVMDSPCNSPASPQVPPPPPVQHAEESVAPTNVFQQKLDEFLMQARKTVEEQKTTTQTPKKKTSPPPKNPKTPLALSHLPISSQLEYRRLVARMNQLERQKKRQLEQKNLPPAKKAKPPPAPETTVASADKSVLKTSNNIKVVVQNIVQVQSDAETGPVDSGQQKETTEQRTVVVRKEELRKKVLMKTVTAPMMVNGGGGGPQREMTSALKELKKKAQAVQKSKEREKNEEEMLEKFFKEISTFSDEKRSEVLEIYENHFTKTSTTFLEGLDNLLTMVKRVQSEKMEQYRLQDELIRLRRQVKLVEDTLSQQKQVVQNLTPKMTQQHKNILKHRNKCVTLNKMCLKLGQMVKGAKYRPPADSKKKLMEKFKDLALETKRLKEIQVIDGTKVPPQEVTSTSVSCSVEEEKQQQQHHQKTKDSVSSENQASSSSSHPQPLGGNTQNSYKSPLDHMYSEKTSNPDAVVCPFDLLGTCEDAECHFSHVQKQSR